MGSIYLGGSEEQKQKWLPPMARWEKIGCFGLTEPLVGSNLVALEISSFKCGHDAPIYGVIEGIIEQSGTPYLCFKDLEENKPSGSIKIRVETIDYFLRRYREEVIHQRKQTRTLTRNWRRWKRSCATTGR